MGRRDFALLGALAAGGFLTTSGAKGVDFNARVLAALKKFPTGGGYNGSDATKNLLVGACSRVGREGTFQIRAPRPSFCSGATYLVLLEALGAGPAALLPVPDQQDGQGIFGRWNANGPGAAKLVRDLQAGVNFPQLERAQAGDFLKIWWTEEIGGRERGHHVVYLGHGAKNLRYWSSNQPDGYGEAQVALGKCRRLLFTRVTHPEAFAGAGRLPKRDPWLERMLRDDFTWPEVAAKCGV